MIAMKNPPTKPQKVQETRNTDAPKARQGLSRVRGRVQGALRNETVLLGELPEKSVQSKVLPQDVLRH